MRDITLKITGKQRFDDNDEEQMEFVTEGKLYERQNAVYIVYEESELSGLAGVKTTLRLRGDTLRMKRIGESGFNSELYFEEGQRFTGTYETPFGTMGLEVLTRAVQNRFDAETASGSIGIDYDVALEGMAEGKNRIEIQVLN